MVQLLPVDNAAYAQYGVVSRKLLLHKEGWNTCVVMCKGAPKYLSTSYEGAQTLHICIMDV